MALLLGSMALLLTMAPLGKCFPPSLAAWTSACHLGGSVRVTSSGGIKLSQDNCDAVYDKNDWQKKPTITYPDAEESRRYTVFVLDPDVPEYPNGTYYLHMLQANVKGEDLKEGNFMRSMTLAPYVGPAPPEGSGLHRYMFVIYQHCRAAEILPSMKIDSISKFELEKFLASIPIKLLGPKAGVQFRAGY